MLKIKVTVVQIVVMVFAVLVLIDAGLQLANAAKQVDDKSRRVVVEQSLGFKPEEKGKLVALQSVRIASAVSFIVLGVLFSNCVVVSMLITTIYFVLVFIISVLLISFFQFHNFIFSLLVHIFMIFASASLLLNQVFEYFKIEDYRKQKKESGDKIHVPGGVKFLTILSDNMMAFSTLASVVIAILFGMIIRETDTEWNERHLVYVGFLGEIFLRMLKCLILPLIFSSLVFAIGNIDARLSGRIAVRAISYYFSTTFVAIIIGIILVSVIQPGKQGGVDESNKGNLVQRNITTTDTILDLIRNLFPSNIFEATMYSYSTKLTCNLNETACQDTKHIDHWAISSENIFSSNILGVVMFATILGVMISRIAERPSMVILFQGLNNAMMEMTTQVIRVTPFAVVFLVLPQIIKVKDLSVLFGGIGYYSLTVLAGIAVQAFCTLPIIYFVFTRKNPLTLLKHMSPAMVTAFGTSSSSATMPITFQCLEESAGLDKRIVRFCIPIGATINMDGTALYEAVAAIFIAQFRGVPLDFAKLVIISITATAASIGAAGIPQAGLVTMIIVLNAIGLDASDAALIVVVDWILDRVRTMINVLGDAFGCALVDHLSRAEIERFDDLDPIEAFGHVLPGSRKASRKSAEEAEIRTISNNLHTIDGDEN